MTISGDLMHAIFSMDSYNRGYGVGVNLAGSSNRIGRAIIRQFWGHTILGTSILGT